MAMTTEQQQLYASEIAYLEQVARAIAYLRETVNADGSYPVYPGVAPEAAADLIQGLTAFAQRLLFYQGDDITEQLAEFDSINRSRMANVEADRVAMLGE